MFRASLFPIMAVVFAGGLAVPAAAVQPPVGSYAASCRAVAFDGAMLSAECRAEDGAYRASTIDARDCGGEIFNRDGGLQCFARPGLVGRGRAIVRGSYVDTCRDISVNALSVQARCKDRGGTLRVTRLTFQECMPHPVIDNDDGRLTCHR